MKTKRQLRLPSTDGHQYESLLARHIRVQHVFASCGDCGQSRVKEDEDRRTTNRATKLRHVEWEMDAAAAAAAKASGCLRL